MKHVPLCAIVLALLFSSMAVAEPAEKGGQAPSIDEASKILLHTKLIEALGRIGDPKARGIFLEGLKNREFFVRAQAAWALGAIGDKESVPALLKLAAGDDNYLVRIFATSALVMLQQIEPEKALRDFINDESAAVRASAVEQLGGSDDKCLAMVVGLIEREKDSGVQSKAIKLLAESKFVSAAPKIRKLLEDESGEVRQMACFAMGEFGDKRDIPLLIERLGDSSLFVRASAKESLGRLGERSLIKFFWQDVEDKDVFLKTSSFLALASLNDIGILPLLLKELAVPENPTLVRTSAAKALVILKPRVLELIDIALSLSKTEAVPVRNLDISFKIEGQNLLSRLQNALNDKADGLRTDAPFMLLELRDETCLAALRQALDSDDPDFVASVIFALGILKDKGAVSHMIRVSEKYKL